MGTLSNWPADERRQSRMVEKLDDEERFQGDVGADGGPTLVVGSTNLYDENGQIRLIPVRRCFPLALSESSQPLFLLLFFSRFPGQG